jgi:hypothetical protein
VRHNQTGYCDQTLPSPYHRVIARLGYAPGALGPPNTGSYLVGGQDGVESEPGSGIWLPKESTGNYLWEPSYPGELAPWGYEEIAPGKWWPRHNIGS